MKFSRVNIYPFGYQPTALGVQRDRATVPLALVRLSLPHHADMVGRELFGDSKKFWNPDLPAEESYRELVAAGERQIHNLIEHAHRRGLETNNYADITQFPPEFAPLLKDAQKVRQLGQLMVVPGASTPVDDASYRDLCTAVLKTIIETISGDRPDHHQHSRMAPVDGGLRRCLEGAGRQVRPEQRTLSLGRPGGGSQQEVVPWAGGLEKVPGRGQGRLGQSSSSTTTCWRAWAPCKARRALPSESCSGEWRKNSGPCWVRFSNPEQKSA